MSQGSSYIISALVLESRGLGKRNSSVDLSDSVSDMPGRSTGKSGAQEVGTAMGSRGTEFPRTVGI